MLSCRHQPGPAVSTPRSSCVTLPPATPQVLSHGVCLPAPLPLPHRTGLALSPSEDHTLLELWACVSLRSPVPSVPAVVSASCTLDDGLAPCQAQPVCVYLAQSCSFAGQMCQQVPRTTNQASGCVFASRGVLGGKAPSHLLPPMHTPRPPNLTVTCMFMPVK